MGAAKRSFEEYREYISTLEAVKGGKFKENTLFQKTCKLAHMVAPGMTGDLKGFRLLVQANINPDRAARLTLGPHKPFDNSQVKEPKNRFGDFWEDWRYGPDTYDEERDNRA